MARNTSVKRPIRKAQRARSTELLAVVHRLRETLQTGGK